MSRRLTASGTGSIADDDALVLSSPSEYMEGRDSV